MLIIAMNRLVIMHDQRHIHVIMNFIVNPTLGSLFNVKKQKWLSDSVSQSVSDKVTY